MAEIIDGKSIAEEVTGKVKAATATFAAAHVMPGLAVVIVGDDAASHVYVASKTRKAKDCGFHSVQHSLPEETTEQDLLALVEELNGDPSIHGILVQLPLPKHMDEDRVIQTILPEKDVDGFNFINVGRLGAGKLKHALLPCTPAGCMILISRVRGHDLSGLSAVVVGRSNIVGRPTANLLIAANATVTVAHSRTRDLASVVRGADIVVAAAGQPGLIRGDWIKPGATVIDVGISRVPAPEKGEGKTRLVGDVAFAEAEKVAGAITPVPGGVGPMTIAMLMAGTLRAACLSVGQEPPDL